MKTVTLDLLVCPDCSEPFRLEQPLVVDGDVVDGSLRCTRCASSYQVEDGLPIILDPSERAGDVAESFGFEWQTWHDGGFEDGTVFGRPIDEDVQSFLDGLRIDERDLDGATVLDAGCGSGALTMELARRYPKTRFVGVDVNPSIAEAQRKANDLPNLELVRGSIFALPFPAEHFDLVWCNGVIHHTGDTAGAFAGLVRVVKPGGRLYVWVYERKVSPFAATRAVLERVGLRRWSHERIYQVSCALARLSSLAVRPLTLLKRLPLGQRRTTMRVWSRDRGYGELVITWFDVLSPTYRDTYRTSELEDWFRIAGFDDLSTTWWPVGVAGTKADPASRPAA